MSIVIKGWTCTCGIFNGEEKDLRDACRSCDAARPIQTPPGDTWQQRVLREKGMCGTLVVEDGVLKACILTAPCRTHGSNEGTYACVNDACSNLVTSHSMHCATCLRAFNAGAEHERNRERAAEPFEVRQTLTDHQRLVSERDAAIAALVRLGHVVIAQTIVGSRK